jgi:hypothetical protein
MTFKIDATKQKQLLESLEVLKEFIECLETEKGCISCAHWKNDACSASNDKVPPPEVIKSGCKTWMIFDSIPY